MKKHERKMKILDDVHVFFSECVFFTEKINNQCWTISFGCDKDTHFTEEIDEQNFSPFNNNYSFGIIIHSTTTLRSHFCSSLMQGCPSLCANSCRTLAVDIMAVSNATAEPGGGDSAGFAWLKHERQTVRMVLAETFHHSSAPFQPKFKEEWVGRHE